MRGIVLMSFKVRNVVLSSLCVQKKLYLGTRALNRYTDYLMAHSSHTRIVVVWGVVLSEETASTGGNQPLVMAARGLRSRQLALISEESQL